MFNDDIFVMFVDDVLMDFLNDGGSNVLSNVGVEFVSLNGLTFIGLLVDSLLVMGDNNWLFVDLLNNNLTFNVSVSVGSTDKLCTT